MKKHASVISFVLIFCGSLGAQIDTSIINYITITGQYVDGAGIELRWFPSNRSVMTLGLEKGYRIERAEVPTSPTGTLQFQVIKTINTYNSTNWSTAIAEKNTLGVANNLPELAEDFSETVKDRENPIINIQPDAQNLKVLKHEENNEHGSLMLTAIQDKEVAIGLGIGMVDSTAVSGATYMYRAVIDRPLPTSGTGLSKTTTLASKAMINNMDVVSMETIVKAVGEPALVNNSVQVKSGDGAITIHWDERPGLSGYYIERSSNPNGGFEKLNAAPILHVRGANYHGPKRGSFHDDKVQNERTYYYRISSHNLFGDKIVVANVEGQARDLTPPEEPFLEQPKHINGKVELQWKFFNPPANDLSGFKVYHSTERESGYAVINNAQLPVNTRTYAHSDFNARGANYYKVEAYDANGNMSASLPAYAVIIDSIPPSKPKDISADISQDGEVQIVIPKQEDDDVIGYKIYKANQADHEFIVVDEYFPDAVDPNEAIRRQEEAGQVPVDQESNVKPRPQNDLQFLNREPENSRPERPISEKYQFSERIPLKTLTPNIYYKVKAFDRNYNQSEFSALIEIEKPDIVPPPRSIFRNVSTDIGVIHLDIVKAKAKDLNRIELSRQENGARRWQLIQTFQEGKQIERFTDQKIEPGKSYLYRLQSIDHNNLRSAYAYSQTIKSINRIDVASVSRVNARAKQEQVTVSWNHPFSDEIFFVVFRKNGKNGWRQVGRSQRNQYVDKRVSSGQYEYAVKTYRKDGNKSEMSRVAKVSVR
ncbi:MAG: hypothetical protein KJP00_12265 [Bacteroidia bacterium]|nr:hypothetical protein [Bacteroidia bacterium]